MKDYIGLPCKLFAAATATILLSLWIFCGIVMATDTSKQLIVFGGKKWIRDIHNGISDSRFYHTGGQSILPDADGVLRYTPPGEIATKGAKFNARQVPSFSGIVVALGDSVTESDYPKYLYVLLPHVSAIHDKGLSGNTTTQMLARINTDVIDLSADLCLVLGGVNDIANDVPLATMQSNITGIVDALEAADIDIVLSEITPWKGFTGWTEARQLVTDQYNAWLSSFAAQRGITCVSMYSRFEDPGNPDYARQTFVLSDKLHPTAVGGWQMASIFADAIPGATEASKLVASSYSIPTAFATKSVSTAKGRRTFTTNDTFLGLASEPLTTNRVTSQKLNPTATTNISVAGGVSVTLVDDMSAINSALIYAGIKTAGNVFKATWTGAGTVTIGGTTGSTSASSASVDYRVANVTGSAIQFGIADSTLINLTSETYARAKQENITPGTTSKTIVISKADGAGECYFFMPQLQALKWATSRIVGTAILGSDTAASQSADDTYNSANVLDIMPSGGQNFAIYSVVSPDAAGVYNYYPFVINNADNTDYLRLYAHNSGTSMYLYKRVNSSDEYLQITTTAHQYGYRFAWVYIQSDKGQSVKFRHYNSGWSAWSSWVSSETTLGKSAYDINDATIHIGYRSGGAGYPASTPLTAIIQLPTKSTLSAYQAWVEAELVKRGLL